MKIHETLANWDGSSPVTIETDSTERTWQLAREFAQALPADVTLALIGDLGAGKTTFIKGLAQAWEIPSLITSPTFNLMNIHQGKRQLVHIDAYRLENPDAWEDLMVEDFLQSPWCLAIEWANRLPHYPWPGPTYTLQFERLPTGKHRIYFRKD